ncbi:MAG: 50S ribosomal protein L23 [Candidatus Colwellbacteria bacterium CG10_big_fil_rev_8_21_14_0_10_41_28]|uniref:Large ribosomal subunit protein uL23 n=1 Tax=Candidatus Colwellbacteria bacterium CG10_big_fil_rev_8_21_14_0_10_41_28 TaxID=1974539 RepID=A0A2H0VH78_9BACT|nr:MAG: 50S ribosomal protein L23 [Candidatus Colwellbacteria bacterium CG10_big_fil_rev_8_21_14_0_10_41_28]
MQSSDLIIKNPFISEKATDLAGLNKYVFEVHKDANKKQVEEVIEGIYKVDVVKVNIIRNRNRKDSFKKAIVTLKDGQTIDVVPH